MLDYTESPEVLDLRSRIRHLIDEMIPDGYLGAFTDDPNDLKIAEEFCQALGRHRLLALAWPVDFGGGGASSWEQTALREEMWAAHEPRGAQYMGINWVGPVIMRHGTKEQQEAFLPPIAAGEVIWCQGFSEPGAGSDLPALRTSARRTEGGWHINGQKIWTSYARMAQWCFLLARTGAPGGRKDGITVFLLDMQQPGVEARPVHSMLGNHHLNEIYFTDAFVPDAQVLGTVGDGWSIITDVLAFERVGIARYARCERLLSEAPTALADRWQTMPAGLVARWARALVRTREARLLAYKVVDHQNQGGLNPADAAAYRMAVTTLDQEVAEVLMDLVGPKALDARSDQPEFQRAVEDHWRYAQASTVASGTIEMQKQLLGKKLVSL
ncbi:acyl-CoA dehydrogenase [Nocardioides immobilis]|uniref:Acyl-CoA dehydrogenase n=1 Tax=Nocardioides immobilis TaxID=2049295 RepID=A0A417Y0T2_9ACTN|nr:acyl-CoA dehydrogenase family protein [Nocardioides immobilis]RHW26215.1 acyl-CoA dehydrogenase [Nocardioides immobilis]